MSHDGTDGRPSHSWIGSSCAAEQDEEEHGRVPVADITITTAAAAGRRSHDFFGGASVRPGPGWRPTPPVHSAALLCAVPRPCCLGGPVRGNRSRWTGRARQYNGNTCTRRCAAHYYIIVLFVFVFIILVFFSFFFFASKTFVHRMMCDPPPPTRRSVWKPRRRVFRKISQRRLRSTGSP